MNMRTVRTVIAAALCGLLPAIATQPAAAESVQVGGDIKIHGDGDRVAIGGDVTIDEKTGGDVAVIGGDVEIKAEVTGDIGVVGGDVRIAAPVRGDVGVASGNFILAPEGLVEGDLGVAAGEAVIDGTVRGDAGIAGGTVTVSGVVEKDLEVKAGEVIIKDGARIGGRLIVKGPKEPTVAPGATITNGVEYTYVPEGAFVWDDAIVHGGLFALLAISVMSFLLLAPIALVIGLFLVLIMASFSERTVEAFNGQPVSSFFAGIGVVVLLPLAIVLLAATIIGIPLAILLAPLYPFWLLLGFVGGALGLSRLPFRDRVPSKGMQLLALLVALLAIAVLAWIPFVGHAVLTVLFLMGTGALTLALFRNGEGQSAPAAQAA